MVGVGDPIPRLGLVSYAAGYDVQYIFVSTENYDARLHRY